MSSPRASWEPRTRRLPKSVQAGALSPGDELPVEVEQRVGVLALAGHVALLRIDQRQPRRAGREAALRRAVPLHRVARAVAAGAVDRRVGAGAVLHPDLLPLVDERRAGEREQELGRVARVLASPAG